MRRAAISLLLSALLLLPGRAEDLTTRDGSIYKNFKVLSHDAGFVTIMYVDGGAKVPLSQLPADLQTKYGYDPATAAAAVQAAAAQDKKERDAAAAAEKQQHLAATAAPVQTKPATPAPPPKFAAITGAAPPAVTSGTPAGALTWHEVEDICDHIADLNIAIDRISQNNGSRNDDEKQSNQTEIDRLKKKLGDNEALLARHLVPGPRLSEAQLAKMKQDFNDLAADMGTSSHGAQELGDATQSEKVRRDEQTLYRLNLEINYAND